MAGSKTVLLAGALDTKAADFAFIQGVLHELGVSVLMADFGIFSDRQSSVDTITNAEIAEAGGSDLADLRAHRDKSLAMQVMSQGLAVTARELHRTSRMQGMLSLGGTSGTAIATAAMRQLPIGFPKVMISTVAGGDTTAYSGQRDIVMIPSIADVAGLNRISRPIYWNGACCIAGMVLNRQQAPFTAKPVIAASMFGNTTPCIERARFSLEQAGCELIVFHATGAGGRTMQALVGDGLISGLLDLTTTELADEVCSGVFSAGRDRVRMGESAAIPVVLAPGCVDMCNFGAPETVPEHYRGRSLYQWNANVTLLRTNETENQCIGELLAETANRCAGPVTVLLPLGGVSMLDSPGQPFWDLRADAACYDAIRRKLRSDIRCIEIDANINDPKFADRAAAELLSGLTLTRGENRGIFTARSTPAPQCKS